jgi:hypothetical protein
MTTVVAFIAALAFSAFSLGNGIWLVLGRRPENGIAWWIVGVFATMATIIAGMPEVASVLTGVAV